MTDPSARVERRADVAWVDTGDRIAIMRLHDLARPPLTLQGSAAEAWRALGAGLTVDDLVEELAVRYGAPAAELRPDVVAWVAEACSERILSAT